MPGSNLFMPPNYPRADFLALASFVTTGQLTALEDIGTTGSPGDLRNTTGIADKVVVTRGFWSADDGGGGIFAWVVDATPPADNGGTIIVPPGTPGGYWMRLFEGSKFNAKWFGARSAEADNTTYISSIISYLGSNSGTIFFPQDPNTASTTYVFDNNLTIPSNIGLVVETPGAILSPNSTYTLTVNGQITAGPEQIFSGAGDVVIGGGEGWSNWFSTINKALNCGLGFVKTRSGTYEEIETINHPSKVFWYGDMTSFDDGDGVRIKPTSAVHRAIKTDASHYIRMSNITVDMANMTDEMSYGPVTTISFTNSFDGGTISDSANGLGSFEEGEVIGVTGSTSNDGTYVIITVAAGALTVKGLPMQNESAGASITLNEGPIGFRLKGARRGLFEFIQCIHPGQYHGWSGCHATPQSSSGFALYYNQFNRCGFKSLGGAAPKYGHGFTASAVGAGAVTNNTLVQCEVQACDIDYLFCSTGSGFMLVNCNGESARSKGCYVTDTPSADTTAVKVLGGEWDSFGAGEPRALFVWQSTANSGYDDNTLFDAYGKVFNAPIRADYYIGKELIVNDLVDTDTLDASVGEHIRIEGDSGAVTLSTTTPIADGDRGQRLELIGNSNTNTVTIVNGGNVQLTQPIWYARLQSTIRFHWSQTASQWIEDGRTEPNNPFIIRSRNNALLRARNPEEEELDLAVSGTWASAIAIDDEVEYVLARVTETLVGSGVTGFSVGTAGDPDLWGNITGTAVGTSSYPRDFTVTTRYIASAGQNIIVTGIGGTITDGKIRLVKFYRHCDPPDA